MPRTTPASARTAPSVHTDRAGPARVDLLACGGHAEPGAVDERRLADRVAPLVLAAGGAARVHAPVLDQRHDVLAHAHDRRRHRDVGAPGAHVGVPVGVEDQAGLPAHQGRHRPAVADVARVARVREPEPAVERGDRPRGVGPRQRRRVRPLPAGIAGAGVQPALHEGRVDPHDAGHVRRVLRVGPQERHLDGRPTVRRHHRLPPALARERRPAAQRREGGPGPLPADLRDAAARSAAHGRLVLPVAPCLDGADQPAQPVVARPLRELGGHRVGPGCAQRVDRHARGDDEDHRGQREQRATAATRPTRRRRAASGKDGGATIGIRPSYSSVVIDRRASRANAYLPATLSSDLGQLVVET